MMVKGSLLCATARGDWDMGKCVLWATGGSELPAVAVDHYCCSFLDQGLSWVPMSIVRRLLSFSSPPLGCTPRLFSFKVKH